MSKILDLSILRMASIKLKSSGSDKFNMNYGVDYNILEAERSSLIAQEFEQRLSRRTVDSGGGFRSTVLSMVVSHKYDRAIEELNAFTKEKADFPQFRARTKRYLQHCIDLISAIKAKREFPGISTLSVSKQQELFEKVIEHFDELKQFLKRIEAVGHEVRLDDIRSTVIFLKTFIYSFYGIIIVMFFLELKDLLITYGIVMGDAADRFTDWLFSF